nr:putative reverse transcriptase domain-containing protein [Tanacetum cinerariifolium]
QNENVVEEVVDAAQVSTAAIAVTLTTEEITLTQALEALKTSKPNVKRIVFQEPAKIAEEKRNKPPTQAQQRKIMCTYLKNMEGYTLKQLKLFEFDRIQEVFDIAFRRVNTFKDFRTELVERKEKIAGLKVVQDITKKQKSMQIYMLVEKKYPLTPPTLSMMLEKKLIIDYEIGDRVMHKVSPWEGVVHFGKRRKLNPRYVGTFKKCYADEPLAVPLDGLHFDDKLHSVEDPIEIIDLEVKRLKRSRIPIVKVRWNSRRGPEFTWEREDQLQKKYSHLFTKTTPSSSDAS